jgi:hypothetical protein
MMPPLRVWRVRKNSTWLDARIDGGDDGVELQFFRDNALISARRWPSREDAMAAAARQLGELQRAGWTTHW